MIASKIIQITIKIQEFEDARIIRATTILSTTKTYGIQTYIENNGP